MGTAKGTRTGTYGCPSVPPQQQERGAAAGPDPRPEFLLVRDGLRKMKVAEVAARQM